MVGAMIGAMVGVVGSGGCTDGAHPFNDGGSLNTRLVILAPGDDLGLTYNERITLRVRYEDELGQRLKNQAVDFALVATESAETTAGSVLSATTVTTDAEGVAAVDVVAGAGNGSFRVSADARDAPTAFIYIEISDGGFARLLITPRHMGWRAPASLDDVEVRLYRADALSCAQLDIDDRPVSVSPPRSLDGFGGAVEYQSVSAGQAQTVVAWAEGEGRVPVSVGCVDLGALPPSPVEFAMMVEDRPLSMDVSPVTTTLDLTPVAAALEQLGAIRPWHELGCPAGPGQLLLECALDAQATDGALDCIANGTSPLVDAVAARRGALGIDGCRALVDGLGAPSLDALLTEAVARGGSFPVAGDLAGLIEIRAGLLQSARLGSELGRVSDNALSHRLTDLTVTTAAGEDHALALLQTSRPVLDQGPIATAWQGPVATLDAHGFTLRYGAFARGALAALALEPAGLAGESDTLGGALARSVSDGGLWDCAAVSALVCTDVGRVATCLENACQAGVIALDQRMSEWWRALDGGGLDLVLAGDILAHDDDTDGVVEAVSAPLDVVSPWSAIMTLAGGQVIDVPVELGQQ